MQVLGKVTAKSKYWHTQTRLDITSAQPQPQQERAWKQPDSCWALGEVSTRGVLSKVHWAALEDG